MEGVKNKAISAEYLKEILTEHFNSQGMYLTDVTGLPESLSVSYTEQAPLKITDHLRVQAVREKFIYLPDLPIFDDCLRKVLRNMLKNDQTILKIVCGIDQGLQANLKESILILRKKGIKFSSDKELRTKLYDLGNYLKEEMGKVYRPTPVSYSNEQLMHIRHTDIAWKQPDEYKFGRIDKMWWKRQTPDKRKELFFI